MKVEFVFVICSLFITLSQQTPSNARSSENGLRVNGGTPAAQGEFPFMVAIIYEEFFKCGGTILSTEWILTAAHCVYNLTSSEFIIVSGTITPAEDNVTKTTISQVILHEKYVPTGNLANDIAVLKLSVALEYGDNVKPVTLPSYKEAVSDYANTTIVGWGYTKGNSSLSPTLLKASVFVAPNDVCFPNYAQYNVTLLPTNICAGIPQGGVGQCKGDSGGPLLYSNNGTYKQIGIISFSTVNCALRHMPGVSTRVCEYRNWISTNTGV